MLLNVRSVALGKVNDVLTSENLRRAYGGRTAFLAEAAAHGPKHG